MNKETDFQTAWAKCQPMPEFPLILGKCECGEMPTTIHVNVGFQIQCQSCGRAGPFKDNEDESIKAWNSNPTAGKLYVRLNQVYEEIAKDKGYTTALEYFIQDTFCRINNNDVIYRLDPRVTHDYKWLDELLEKDLDDED